MNTFVFPIVKSIFASSFYPYLSLKVDFLNGNIGKSIWRFTYPMLLGNIFQQLYNLTDSAIVGHFLGTDALSAVGASFPLIFALIALVMGVTTGSSILIAQFHGARKPQSIKSAVDSLFIFLFISALLLAIVGYIFSFQILTLMNLPLHLMPLAQSYLHVSLLGFIPLFGYNAVSGVLRGIGDSRTPLRFLIVATLLNIFLDLFFVVVLKTGVEGTAWATVIAQTVAFVLGIRYLAHKQKDVPFQLWQMKFEPKIFFVSIKIGLPSGIQHMLVALGMVALSSMVNTYGAVIIAAYSVAGRIDSFALMPAMNLSQALTTFVGQNIGAGQMERVKRGLYATIGISMIISIFISTAVWLFGDYMIRLFTSDASVIAEGKKYLIVVSSFYFLFSIMFSINGLLRGVGLTHIPMFVTLVALWLVRIPSAWVYSQQFGHTGIWWGVPSGWIAGTIIAVGYYKFGKWENKNLLYAS